MQIVQIYIDELNQINTNLSTMMICNEIFFLMDLKKRRYEKEIILRK